MVYRLVLSPEQQQQQELITLTAAQRHYLGNVLRLADGDRLMVMDGRGGLWLATFLTSTVQRLQPIAEDRELPVTVTLAIALPKGNSFDDVLRACTELGATCFQPILSQRTLLKPSAHKQARWQRIVTEAAEQCERQWIPDIAPPVSWTDFLSSLSDSPNAPSVYFAPAVPKVPDWGHT